MTKQIIDIDQLYKYENEEFLKETFKLLLNREIDEKAYNHYLQKFSSGKTKSNILNQIISSNEFQHENKQINNKNKLLSISNILQKNVLGKPLRQYSKSLRILDKEIQRVVNFSESLLIKKKEENSSKGEMQRFSIDPKIYTDIDILHDRLLDLESDNIKYRKLIKQLIKENNLVFDEQKSNKICLNITTTKRWRSRTVGIVRTERELAKYLFENVDNAIFTIWDEDRHTFLRLPLGYVKEILKDEWLDTNQNVIDFNNDKFEKLKLNSNDTLISIGLDWDNNLTKKIYDLKQVCGCKVVLGCYDIIPILYPEHTVSPNFKQLFQEHFVDMYFTADLVWTDSTNSKKDLLNFWQNTAMLDLEQAPLIKFITLGANLNQDCTDEMSEFEKGQLRHILSLGDYAMYVSSFESRKNHKLLLDIWREGFQKYDTDWPTLVIVGRHGWGVDDLISHMNRMLATKAEKIIWLDNASDSLLDALYDNVSFTLFPSLYEGWGLAAAESLRKGKPCIVANNSSLIEATQNLMPSIHPLDYPNWLKEIELIVFNKNYLNKLKEEIRLNFKETTWHDFSKNFLSEINTLNTSQKLSDGE